MPSIEDTDPWLPVNGTCSELLICRYARDGCRKVTKFTAGQYRTVRDEMDAHEIVCVHRYFPDRSPRD